MIFFNKKNNQKIRNKTVLYLNDTYNDFHYGCTGTSYVIRKELQKKFKSIQMISVEQISRNIKIAPKKVSNFTSTKFFNNWKNKNSEIIEKIKNNDYIVVNGEGCISHYNDGTCNLLYAIYISKIKYKKNVSIINHSVFLKNYVDHLSPNDENEFKKIIKLVYQNIDFCAVREFHSLIQLNYIIQNKGILSFDSLPLYISRYFKKPKKNKNQIVITGGNFLNPKKFAIFIKKLIETNSKLKNKKIVFLYSENINSPAQENILILQAIKKYIKKIEIIKAKSLNEWLSVIQESKLLISGRFHHSIAAFMLDTPFLVFKTNTLKVEAFVSMISKEDSLLRNYDDYNFNKAIHQLNSKNFYQKNNKYIKDCIISLAKNNFNFTV